MNHLCKGNLLPWDRYSYGQLVYQPVNQANGLGKETKKRLTKGLRLVELFKQVNGSPLYLANQLSILSLANQDLIKSLTIKEVSLLINLYS